jgi:hypothetical protein
MKEIVSVLHHRDHRAHRDYYLNHKRNIIFLNYTSAVSVPSVVKYYKADL